LPKYLDAFRSSNRLVELAGYWKLLYGLLLLTHERLRHSGGTIIEKVAITAARTQHVETLTLGLKLAQNDRYQEPSLAA